MSNYGYKVRIYPSKAQKSLVDKTFGCVRKFWNEALSERKRAYEQHKDNKTALKAVKYRTPKQIRDEFPYMKECDSHAFCCEELYLKQAYANFYSKKAEFPKFKKKSMEESYQTSQIAAIRLNESEKIITLPKLGFVRFRSKPRGTTGKIKNATISRDSCGHYHCSLLFDVGEVILPDKVEIESESQIAGLDMSFGKFYVDSNGESPDYERLYRKAEKKEKYLKKQQSRKVKGSRRYKKLKLSIARLHNKTKNKRNDFIIKEARKVTDKFDKIVVEDLNMCNMAQTLHNGKSSNDLGWGSFVNKLEYYCELNGKIFVKADKWFPSSKTCSYCGQIKQDLKLSDRIYKCECGLIMDRDHNAAINLKKIGLEDNPLMLVEPPDYRSVDASNMYEIAV